MSKLMESIKQRPFFHKWQLLRDKRVPKKAKKEIAKTLFTPKQNEFLNTTKEIDAILIIHHGGTGSGKTHGNNEAFRQLLIGVRKEATRLRGKGYTPIVILAGYKQENIINNIIMPLEDNYGITVNFDKNGNFMLYGVKVVTTFLNSPRGEASIRGLDAWGAYVNEATTANRSAFEEIRKRLRGGEKPILIADTNPDHPMHWLKVNYIDKSYKLGEERDLEAEANGDKIKGIYSVHSTPEDNPYLPASYIESLHNMPPGASKDRALGYWTTGSGAVYSHFDPKYHYITADELPDRSEFKEFFVGVDWGWKDPTVFTLFGRAEIWNEEIEETEERTYLLKEVTKSYTHIEYWQELAQEWQKEYGRYTPFYCDSANPDKIDKLVEVGIDAFKADKNISNGIESVSELIEEGRFFVVEDEVDEFKKEINSYEWNEKTGQPVDKDNHVLDATRYAIHTHKEEGAGGFGFY